MTSLVTEPEPPLGSEDNPRPFIRGEKRIKDDIYFNSFGEKKRWDGKKLTSVNKIPHWTYNRLIELLKNTGFTLLWNEKEFDENCKNNRTERGVLQILIEHSCGCYRLRSIHLIQKSIKRNSYLCGNGGGNSSDGSRGFCKKINGQTYNEDKTKKYCIKCKNMLLLHNFFEDKPGKLYCICTPCLRLKEKEFREKNIKNRLIFILRSSRKTTKTRIKRGREHDFNIDLEYVLELWEKCNGICFRYKKKMSILDGDMWLVSIDRIDPKKGYIKGNVQLVSWLYNRMKWKNTEEEMDQAFDQLRLVYSNTSL
tara:strand:+ start:166 stop:1095 length:930 start_codon:yes stop_codon:yes gene_type:complete